MHFVSLLLVSSYLSEVSAENDDAPSEGAIVLQNVAKNGIGSLEGGLGDHRGLVPDDDVTLSEQACILEVSLVGGRLAVGADVELEE